MPPCPAHSLSHPGFVLIAPESAESCQTSQRPREACAETRNHIVPRHSLGNSKSTRGSKIVFVLESRRRGGSESGQGRTTLPLALRCPAAGCLENFLPDKLVRTQKSAYARDQLLILRMDVSVDRHAATKFPTHRFFRHRRHPGDAPCRAPSYRQQPQRGALLSATAPTLRAVSQPDLGILRIPSLGNADWVPHLRSNQKDSPCVALFFLYREGRA